MGEVASQKENSHSAPDYDSLQSVLKSIAQWIKKYSYVRDHSNDLANCGPDEVANIARDLRLGPRELAVLAKNGPKAADLLQTTCCAWPRRERPRK